MLPHRDDIEALARATDLLFQVREPAELAHRFLCHVAALFEADAGLFFVFQNQSPHLSALRFDPADARRLADGLRRELMAGGGASRVWRLNAEWSACAAWPNALATAMPGEPGQPGVLALFSARPDAFDPERDGRLVGLLARHAAAALAYAAMHERTRRQAERLAIQAEQLEQVRRALERHSREIERSLSTRSRYFAAMSHELRTPINAIVGYNDLLRQGVFGALNPRQTEIASKIGSSVGHLLALVNDLLDLSKIEAGRMEVRRHPVHVPTLVSEAAAVVEGDARAKGLELNIRCAEPVPTLESDPGKLRQILLNLLSNAVKFTDEGSVSLEVIHVRPDDATPIPIPPTTAPGLEGWIAITVQDTGMGIPDEQIDSIFGEFVQLPHSGPGAQGTGLGLAISSRLARLLGGDLTADSEVGVRSTFVLFLPCPAPDAGSARP